jgi:hypothetical protein
MILAILTARVPRTTRQEAPPPSETPAETKTITQDESDLTTNLQSQLITDDESDLTTNLQSQLITDHESDLTTNTESHATDGGQSISETTLPVGVIVGVVVGAVVAVGAVVVVASKCQFEK